MNKTVKLLLPLLSLLILAAVGCQSQSDSTSERSAAVSCIPPVLIENHYEIPMTSEKIITAALPTLNLSAAGNCIGSEGALAIDSDTEIELTEAKFLSGIFVSVANSNFSLPDNHQYSIFIYGVNEAGSRTRGIKKVLAHSDFRDTFVSTDWLWVDLSEFGEIKKIQFVPDTADVSNTVLVDKLYVSDTSIFDTDYETIILVPDTQNYAWRYRDIFSSQYQFIRDNIQKEKIVFVSHLGDITEHGAEGDDKNIEEWETALNAIDLIHNEVPYGVVVGNHDFDDFWNNPMAGSNNFLTYFPESRYAGKNWWCGYSDDKLSSCQRFTLMQREYIYLHLSVDTPNASLEWAKGIAESNPNTPIIITTHVYLNEYGRIWRAFFADFFNQGWQGLSARDFFDDFVALYDNIFMVTCGHIHGEYRQISENIFGNEVYELLQDYQNRVYGGEGYLRMLRFYADKNKITVKSYSPYYDLYEDDEDSQFEINFDPASRIRQEF
jgi:hypothetical protein